MVPSKASCSFPYEFSLNLDIKISHDVKLVEFRIIQSYLSMFWQESKEKMKCAAGRLSSKSYPYQAESFLLDKNFSPFEKKFFSNFSEFRNQKEPKNRNYVAT